MYYSRKTYRVTPEQIGPFTTHFEEYLLPVYRKHGCQLVGRWVTEAKDEIVTLWEYESREEYQRIERALLADPLFLRAQARGHEVGPLFQGERQDFLLPTGQYQPPRHLVAAATCVRNSVGEVLLVRTRTRSDTWEMPGGQVELGEAPHLAAAREVLEESGIIIEIDGLVGVYCNERRDLLNLVFRGRAVGGELATSNETDGVGFFTPEEALKRITRPHFRTRLADALEGHTTPYEAFGRPG